MSTPDDEDTPQADVVVSGSIAALRDLAEPLPALSDVQRQIIVSFNQLVAALDGPRSGSERGPAQPPPWTKQAPRVDTVVWGIEEGPAYAITGTGLESTFAVWIDGRPVHGWSVAGRRGLLVPQPPDAPTAVEILIRTRSGDVVAHYSGRTQ